jgi:hypothetical protein
LAAIVAGAIRFEFGSTAKEATKELAAAESERAALIERINPRVIS